MVKNRLDELRKSKGISQEELAAVLEGLCSIRISSEDFLLLLPYILEFID